MKRESFGAAEDPALVWVLGWGNRIHHENVQWLVDRFVDVGYHVHVFELPDVITDFDEEYLEPVVAFTDSLDSFRLVGHSTGGLIAAYVDGAETTTYLSPWWGFPEGQVGVDDVLLSAFSALPTSQPLVASGTDTREAIGDLATDQQLAEGTSKAAPTFLREARRAQRDRPPIDADAVVFCTLTDRIVGVRAIGDAVPAERIVLYDGGHELFSSPGRDESIERVLAVVDEGAAGL